MEVFDVIAPAAAEVPIVLSSPHSGIGIPAEVEIQLKPEYRQNPDDTDWFIDQLYDFAPSMGITMLRANLSRWVIDLNRDPESQPLYSDGRIITGLVPLTTFNGDQLYDSSPDQEEITRRRSAYYNPYHEKLRNLLHEKVDRFGKVLLFDAHSIRKQVPGIRKQPFPDLILGDADGTSASHALIAGATAVLEAGDYEFSHNHPFKGGFITRNYGCPDKNVHALQLEMAKINYMNDTETEYHEVRASRIRLLLQDLFTQLTDQITS